MNPKSFATPKPHPSAETSPTECDAPGIPRVVRVEGDEWDISTCEQFEAVLLETVKYPRVILDMSAVQYIDSSCLRELSRMYQRRVLQRGFEPARIVISASTVRRLFHIVGFDRMWSLFDSVDAALQDAKSLA
jgi:anti-anti-sigma factor